MIPFKQVSTSQHIRMALHNHVHHTCMHHVCQTTFTYATQNNSGQHCSIIFAFVQQTFTIHNMLKCASCNHMSHYLLYVEGIGVATIPLASLVTQHLNGWQPPTKHAKYDIMTLPNSMLLVGQPFMSSFNDCKIALARVSCGTHVTSFYFGISVQGVYQPWFCTMDWIVELTRLHLQSYIHVGCTYSVLLQNMCKPHNAWWKHFHKSSTCTSPAFLQIQLKHYLLVKHFPVTSFLSPNAILWQFIYTGHSFFLVHS